MRALIAATADGVVRVDADWSLTRDVMAEDVRCLAPMGDTLFAGTQGSGVFRSDDGGRSWRPAGLEGRRVKSLASSDGVIYAGTKEPLVHMSSDRGDTWRALPRFPALRSWWWLQPAERPLRPSYVSALAVSPAGLVAGIEACGLFLFDARRRRWTGHRRRALRDCHELCQSDGLIYEAGSGGLAASRDGGLRWQRRRDGLDRRYGWSVAAAGERVYLVVAPYRSAHTGNARAAVFGSTGRAPWSLCLDGLASLPRLACGPSGDVFAALGDGGVLRSADEGASWERLPVDLGGACRALLVLE